MAIEFRIVVDTGVAVSAMLLPRSIPRQAFDAVAECGRRLLSDATVDELEVVRLSLDYNDSDKTPIEVEATSSDGITYSGTWGYPLLDPRHPVELQLFESKKNNEVVLIGTWKDDVEHRQGVYIFRLWPDTPGKQRANKGDAATQLVLRAGSRDIVAKRVEKEKAAKGDGLRKKGCETGGDATRITRNIKLV